MHSYAPSTALTLKCPPYCIGHYGLKKRTGFCVARFGRAFIVCLFVPCLATPSSYRPLFALHFDFVFALMAVNTCTILCVARYFLKCTGYRNMACDGDKTRGTITKVPGVDIVEL